MSSGDDAEIERRIHMVRKLGDNHPEVRRARHLISGRVYYGRAARPQRLTTGRLLLDLGGVGPEQQHEPQDDRAGGEDVEQ